VPDIVFTLAVAAWAMALAIAVASLFGDSFTVGSAGRILARFFAAALGLSGLLLFLLGVVLLRDDRNERDHYRVPVLLGAGIGLAEAVIMLWPNEALLPLPLLFLVFALRPVRRRLADALHTRAGGGR
jgi:hypothetical protein